MKEYLYLILCLSGLTGAGKTAVSEGVSKLGEMQTVLKVTTRPKRASDLDGEYCFVNSEIYNKMFQEKKFALHTKYYEHTYAIPYSTLEEGKKKNISRFITPWVFGKDSVFDPRIRYVRIWLELSQEERVKRMLNRGDSKEYVAKRLDQEALPQFAVYWEQQRQQCQWVVDASAPLEEVVNKIRAIGLDCVNLH
ncbi:guanylate kinase [Holospora elegans E1]|uniref:Guanylate kinase n=2 Tax=Holospora TaxID=44747 RepID=A0A023DXV0_9PROT|nr:hypothetical protein [Holospora elegans]GAJ45989.1 guanylate kinase [Holospora elegans E1]